VLNKTYNETIDWLFQQFPAYHKIGALAYKPDTNNCLSLCELFQNPQKDLKFIHIAGTNGKGSTTSMLASILQESGKKTGLFTSPHIEDFRERIRVNGQMISEQEVINFCTEVKSHTLDFEPSFFEITWVMALVHFAKQNCDICVIETGLGGRLDATNLITPLLSVITNIGLEHTNFLGTTLPAIAFEKGGIIKPKVPIVIGETVEETKSVFTEIADKNNSTIYFAEENEITKPSDFPLLGEYQQKNFRTVTAAIEVLQKVGFKIQQRDIDLGLLNLVKNTGFRGRMQVVSTSPLTIMDVSHNFDGIKATLESIETTPNTQLHIVYGTSADKDLDSIFTLFPKNALYFFTEFNNERSANSIVLLEKSQQFKLNSTFFQNPKKALIEAQKSANKEDTILIFGSFFLISDFF
jgi:dihydrofolate synthase / folylpolyglutamate synthase